MINALEAFYEYVIANITDQFYSEYAPTTATFPYCTYSYNLNEFDRTRNDLSITIDIYDLNTINGNNARRVAELIEKFDKNTKFCKFTDDNKKVIGEIIKGTPFMVSIPDPNPDVIRKEINLVLKYY